MINRRSFLKFSAGIGLSLGLNYTEKTLAQTNINNNIIQLNISETNLKIAHKNTKAFTVNNTIPGPLIRLKEGEIATINVTNNLKEDTSIHWHGLILPANMDGVPGVSFPGIKPSETFTYSFPVTQNGTYWYHSHSGMQEQKGHFGPIIIDPADSDPFTYDRDYVIMLSDWTFENPHQVLSNLKKNAAYYNRQKLTIAQYNWEWSGMRMDPTDIADITGATYTYLFNGMDAEANWTGIFQQGEKIRLRFINASAATFFDVKIPSLTMTVINADGQNIQPISVDEFRIGVAETYDVIVEPREEIAYTIFAETMDRSGYTSGTLAPKLGMKGPLPERRKRPLRTMADMGMDHSQHSGPTIDHSQHTTPTMDHSQHTTPTMDHSQHTTQNQVFMHNSDDHGIGNASVAMIAKNRLNEPGVGLENTDNHRVLVYTDLKSLNPYKNEKKAEKEIELNLTGNMERYMWSFDGKKYSEAKEPIALKYGEKVRLTFVNDTMMEHPIHLHGMWMQLDNGNGEYNPRKHTIIVKPAERLSVYVKADALGKWAFHCHLMYHMDTGMFRVVSVS